jgi:hypothetical protein
MFIREVGGASAWEVCKLSSSIHLTSWGKMEHQANMANGFRKRSRLMLNFVNADLWYGQLQYIELC